MTSQTIYHYLSYLHLEDFGAMLTDLQELHNRVSDTRAVSDGCKEVALAQVENSITMVITTLRYAIAAGRKVALSDEYRYDYCLELRATISNAVFINARNIDS